LASTSCNQAARELLALCLADQPWPADLLRSLTTSDCASDLFRVVIERLGDLFEPRLCLVYARLFSQIAAQNSDRLDADVLYQRYLRVREVRPWDGDDPAHVYVLSRVTLGADIAVSNIFLEAAKQRFQQAQIFFAAGAKSAELFALDPRIHHLPLEYPRGGSLAQRLHSAAQLPLALPANTLVLDPDSRLTQLGILPVCDEAYYRFFESRAYGGDGQDSLGTLARRWCQATLGVSVQAAPPHPGFIQLQAAKPCAAVSLGVGGNADKRLDGKFEAGLLALLATRFQTILIDRGAGGEEAQRVDAAIAASQVDRSRFQLWNGSFAGFVSLLSQAQFYAGYDSAGQHAAAACGVPLATIFAGHVSPRMLARWTPSGPASVTVIAVEASEPSEQVLGRVAAVIRTL
jgi:ADP-heptose:LPS heptosyltransferase